MVSHLPQYSGEEERADAAASAYPSGTSSVRLIADPILRLLRPLQFLRTRLGISPHYVRSAPHDQNALDIFKGEWWSQLPPPFSKLRAGQIGMFEDPRVNWALSELGDVNGKTALELGPLEASHTYMLQRAGFESILAIEANPRAYLKCLIVKEIVGLTHARFLCGDFVEYLRGAPSPVDVVFASGVLYHLANPAELIAHASKITGGLYIWTHYFNAGIVSRHRKLSGKFHPERRHTYDGFSHRLFRFDYGRSALLGRFCGGGQAYAHWMLREDIIGCLKHFGFNEVRINFDEPDHANGPALALLALRN